MKDILKDLHSGNSCQLLDQPGGPPSDRASFVSVPDDFNPMDFINVGDTSPIPEGVRSANSRHRTIPTKTEQRIPVDVQRAYNHLVLPRIDTLAVGRRDPLTGQVPQRSKDRLNEHFAAVYDRQVHSLNPNWPITHRTFLSDLRGKDLADHLAGRETYHVRSNWQSGMMLIRLDIDAHHGEPDAEALRSCIDQKFSGLPYWSSSPGGFSGYVWIQVPTFLNEKTGEVQPAKNRRSMNLLRERLHQALSALARATDYKSQIEVKGGFLETEQLYDNDTRQPLEPKHITGGMAGDYLAKLPRVTTMADIEKLTSAVIDADDPLIEQIIREGMPLWKNEQEEKERHRRQAEAIIRGGLDGEIGDTAPARRSGKHHPSIITDHGSKPANYAAAMAEATRMVGISSHRDFDTYQSELKDITNQICIENGFCDNNRDRKRETKLNDAHRFVRRTWDPAKAANGGTSLVWFTYDVSGKHSDDVRRVGSHIKKLNPAMVNARIKAINTILAKLHQPRLRVKKLATIACAIAKDIECPKYTNRPGEVPLSAMVEMLRSLGMSASYTMVSMAVKFLEELGIFKMVSEYIRGVKCRTYVNLRIHWFAFLPGAREAAKAIRLRRQARQSAPAAIDNQAAGQEHSSCVMYVVATSWEEAEDPTIGNDEWAEVGEIPAEIGNSLPNC